MLLVITLKCTSESRWGMMLEEIPLYHLRSVLLRTDKEKTASFENIKFYLALIDTSEQLKRKTANLKISNLIGHI